MWQILLAVSPISTLFFFFKILFIYFLDTGKGKEEEKETNIDQLLLSHSQLGTWPTIQVCALIGAELVTFQCVRQSPPHQATPVRAQYPLLSSFFLTGYISPQEKK